MRALTLILSIALSACGSVKNSGADAGDGGNGAFAVAGPASAMVRQGLDVSLEVTVTRAADFAEDVVITAAGLPDAVAATTFTIAGDQTSGTLRIEAGAGALQGTFAIQLVGTAGELDDAADLRLLVAGGSGTLDLSFGEEGVFVLPGDEEADAFPAGRGIAVAPDGTIVVVGVVLTGVPVGSDALVLQLGPDGSPDPGFGSGGKVLAGDGKSGATCVLLDGDRIVAGGWLGDGDERDFALFGYTASGELDESFGQGGIATHTVADKAVTMTAIALAESGGGSSSGIIGLGSSPGPSGYLFAFSKDGQDPTPFTDWIGSQVEALAVQPDGGILVAGSSSGDYILTRVTHQGMRDLKFGIEGTATAAFTDGKGSPLIDEAKGLALVGDKILVGGVSGVNVSYTLFTPNGVPDSGFGQDGLLVTDTSLVADDGFMDVIPATGHIVVAGAATSGNAFVVAGFLPDGSPDPDFGQEGIFESHFGLGTDRNSGVLDLAVDPDGRILVTGSLAGNLAVARIWP